MLNVLSAVLPYLLFVPVLFLTLILPFVLTYANGRLLMKRPWNNRFAKNERSIEILTLLLGSMYSLVYLDVKEIVFSDWWNPLYNNQRHTPIAKDEVLTIGVLVAVAIVGYLILKLFNITKIPPVIAVFSIGAMYLGIGVCLLWMVQLGSSQLMLLLFPLNCVLLALKCIKKAVVEFQLHASTLSESEDKSSKLGSLFRVFGQSKNWPWLAFLAALPLLGGIVVVLLLFGQQPDSVIRAWTQTSDWTLSQQIAPPNVEMDEHYLCTVAAAGHRKVVKPHRMGVRHGHRVTVNRQLCIANAFEQIMEERIPTIHRWVRGLYDTYGYPFAKKVRSPYLADIIYVLMKPAEYLFLFVIYLCDAHPENRIALQYITQPPVRRAGQKEA